MALNLEANQYTDPANSAKVVDGNITTTVNKGRWARPMNGIFLKMSIHGLETLGWYH